jgi:hypothetical protein
MISGQEGTGDFRGYLEAELYVAGLVIDRTRELGAQVAADIPGSFRVAGGLLNLLTNPEDTPAYPMLEVASEDGGDTLPVGLRVEQTQWPHEQSVLPASCGVDTSYRLRVSVSIFDGRRVPTVGSMEVYGAVPTGGLVERGIVGSADYISADGTYQQFSDVAAVVCSPDAMDLVDLTEGYLESYWRLHDGPL